MLAGVKYWLLRIHLGMLTRGQSVAGVRDWWAAMLWHDAKVMLQAAAMKRRLFYCQQLMITQWSSPVAECMLQMLM